MELRQLRYAEAVATHRHFTRAAAAARVAQPALSHQIKRLEDELGVQLFERGRAGVRLTEAGEVFVARARRALAEIAAMEEEIAALQGLRTGRVVLGAMQALATLDLPAVIAEFHARHPGIDVSLREESTLDMVAMVLSDDIDLAIAALDVTLPAGVEATPLAHEPLVMALPASHPLASRGTVGLSAAADEAFVFFKAGTGLRAITERAAVHAGFVPHVRFETNDLHRILALVAQGLGVALVPASAVSSLPGLVTVDVSPPLERTVGIVRRSGRRHAPAAGAFYDELIESSTGRPSPARGPTAT